MSESTEGSTCSGSGFKASQKVGPCLKVSSDRLGKLGIEFETPGYKASDLSTTPQQLIINEKFIEEV